MGGGTNASLFRTAWRAGPKFQRSGGRELKEAASRNLFIGFTKKQGEHYVFSVFEPLAREPAGALAFHVSKVARWRAVKLCAFQRSAARHFRSM